ncbi:MAG: thioesterase family protein [Bermanella sp.]
MSDNKQAFLRDYALTIHQDVTWGDMDAFGHINNTVYFRYFEDIRIAYFEKTQVNAHKEKTQIGPILGSTQCQFRAPLAFPDHIHIGTRIKEREAIQLGEKRFTMEYAVFSEQQDCIAAKGEGLIVYYNYQQGKSCAIPDSILASINEF